MRQLFPLLFGLALVAAACAGSGATFPDGSIPIQAASDVGVGRGRVLVGIVGPDNSRLGSADEKVDIQVAHEETPEIFQRITGVFTPIVPDAFGLYRAEFDFDRPGIWDVTVIPEEGPELMTSMNVFEETRAPAIGDAAPPAPSPTLDDFPIEDLTTDANPDRSLYELSIAEAVTSGRPSVLVMSTPAFCRTEACGPLLDVVKEAASDYPGVNFVHVEIYTNFRDPGFSPDDASYLAPTVTADWYNLPSEPWVFVTDEAGIIVARFEGVMAAEELEPHLG